MIQLTRQGLKGDCDLAPLRDQFGANHTCRLSKLVSEHLLAQVSTRLECGTWSDREHPGVGRESILEDPRAVQLLNFLANDADFIQFISEISGIPALTRFGGRIYRSRPGTRDEDSWHDDASSTEARMVGMSLNLSKASYEGGVFQLRERNRPERCIELPNTGFGDAILFRISDRLEHRVSKVSGVAPKIAFAGWFTASASSFVDAIRRERPPV